MQVIKGTKGLKNRDRRTRTINASGLTGVRGDYLFIIVLSSQPRSDAGQKSAWQILADLRWRFGFVRERQKRESVICLLNLPHECNVAARLLLHMQMSLVNVL